MTGFAWRLVKRAALLLLALLAIGIAFRAWDSTRGPGLRPWHTEVPDEPSIAAMDGGDWSRWIAAERALFDRLRARMATTLEPEDKVAANRFYAGSPVNPARFAQDWNRSFLLVPDGPPRGAAVFLHGLTDAPYSLRHVAQRYRDLGFVAIGMRMPGHGTVPGGLTEAVWEDWMAATRLAMREARARAGAGNPIHLVGYSNGGALALKHALDALEDPRLPRAERLVLLSPMIGVTAFARFAGLAALPSYLPAFAKTAWLDILPEFNPYKYNSFPANAARQSWRLSSTVQADVRRLAAAGRLADLPPVLTFQSVVDATVLTSAVIDDLHAKLPPGHGSEVVLFDLNRYAQLGPLLSPAAAGTLERLLPPPPRGFLATIVTNAGADSEEAVAQRAEVGAAQVTTQPLGLSWPRGVYSLSHVALPFPVTDGLYGLQPDPADHQGIRLGAVAPRGERGVLVVGPDSLMRISSNPFFPYLLGRIEEGIPRPGR